MRIPRLSNDNMNNTLDPSILDYRNIIYDEDLKNPAFP